MSSELNVKGIILSIKREDAKMLCKIQARQTHLKNQVSSVIARKTEFFRDVAALLLELETKCDSVQSYVEDFLKDRSEIKRFEGRLTNMLKVFKDQQPKPTVNVKKPYTLYEMKVLHAKVSFQVESLETLAKNAAINDQNTSTASAQQKKPKMKQGPPAEGPTSLSPNLDRLISKLKEMMHSTSFIIMKVEEQQQQLTALASDVLSKDQEDFHQIAKNHAKVHDWLDNLERSVYDTTVPHLTPFQRACISIRRPAEGSNPIILITTFADMTKSINAIENRMYRIICFCNSYVDEQRGRVFGVMWAGALVEIAPLLRGDNFPDIPADGAPGQPEADERQGGQPQDDQPHAGEPQEDQEPQGEQPEPQGELPEAGEPQEDQEPQGEQPEAGEPQGEQPQAGEPQAGEPQGEQPQAGEPHGEQPQAGEPQ